MNMQGVWSLEFDLLLFSSQEASGQSILKIDRIFCGVYETQLIHSESLRNFRLETAKINSH